MGRRATLQDKTAVTRLGLSSQLKRMSLLRGCRVDGGRERGCFLPVTELSTQGVSFKGKRKEAQKMMGRVWLSAAGRTGYIICRAQHRMKTQVPRSKRKNFKTGTAEH